MSVVQVRYVQRAIEERFKGLIDLSDVETQPAGKQHEHFLTRGLAALARQSEQPCTNQVAANSVFDGSDDKGLDAVSVERTATGTVIRLYQAKWSDKGKGQFGEAEVHKMIEGLELILDLEFSAFNRRFQRHVPEIESAFEDPNGTPKIILVLALLRVEPLSSGVRTLLEKKIAQFNQVEEMVDYELLDLRDFHRTTLGDAASPKINASLRLEGFGQEVSPYKALYGTVTVPHVAELYSKHRRGLFARNIRASLDTSDVNVKIRGTLLNEARHFWYFSNGITMLCESIKPAGKAVPGGVGDFQLSGVSVVNGAQTVSAIHKAYEADPTAAEHGRVLVRLISLEDCPPGFGDQVTINTNTQNPVEDRDFKSLNAIQTTLRDAFATELSLSYVLKRGEPLPDPEHGTSITEVAEALAATHPDATYAAVAKKDLKDVWHDDVYQQLFGEEPDVLVVWRKVKLLRAVRARLSDLQEGLLGRANAMAVYGDLLITHVTFSQLATSNLSDPKFDWDEQIRKVATVAQNAFEWSLYAIDAEYSISSHIIAAVRNPERIQRVARVAIKGVSDGGEPPRLRTDYQPVTAEDRGRQVDAVRTLVQSGRIPDGTLLEFRPATRSERRVMSGWLAEDEKRSLASWRNDPRNPLTWHYDGQDYSPSGLVRKMRTIATGKGVNVRGTLYWHVPNEGSLKDLAENVRTERDVEAGEDD
ncbi:AIPR family protein [Actinoplanes sp. LDG1-06]|uniref:AIPR family protein n=1 Tax=Paractinoplanes ovalisporus TaxID=2810368 RepID=A0ABS2AGP6_9ACTN|nr:AIPR family protein [Actinoplanes ovalisporus]MBM2619006.1 AIPR family protein [Actinoplanes ovalisporus]